MDKVNPHIEIALMRRVAQHLRSGESLANALTLTADEMDAYYESHMGQKIVKFKLGGA